MSTLICPDVNTLHHKLFLSWTELPGNSVLQPLWTLFLETMSQVKPSSLKL